MADVELVIKIPDHLYKLLKELPSDSNEGNIENVLMKAVEHGTPLPKGHGDLIDADVLCDFFWDNRSKLYTHKDLRIVIDNADAIIKADTEEREEL